MKFFAAETTFKSVTKKRYIESIQGNFYIGSESMMTVNALFESGKFGKTLSVGGGDVLIIDNATVMHARNDFTPQEKIFLMGKSDINNQLKYIIKGFFKKLISNKSI